MGFEKNPLTPFTKAGTKGSKPDAFDTIALSTIEIAGATQSEDKKAAVLSTKSLTGKGEWSSDDFDLDFSKFNGALATIFATGATPAAQKATDSKQRNAVNFIFQ